MALFNTQNAFKLGLSYTPMADVALSALEDWSSYIPKNIMQPYYKDVLPLLDGYLKTATSPGILKGKMKCVMWEYGEGIC